MKRGKTVILLMTVLLTFAVLFFGIEELCQQNVPVCVEIDSEGGTETIQCVERGGRRYVFFPGYARIDQARFRTNFLCNVYINGQKVSENANCADFPLDTKMEMQTLSMNQENWETVIFLQSANVPTMYIDVASGNMDHIHAKKGNEESGTMRLYAADGTLMHASAVESLKGRGNATWEWCEKKPYSLCLSEEADLLGMGSANNWVLLANAYDVSNIRNKIAYDLARDAGMLYTPQCQWVDVYLNGSYAGLYLLSERNEIHPERVDIPADTSFLVSWELESRMISQGYPYVITERGRALRIRHSAFSLSKVQQMWQSVENAICAENDIDPVTGKHWRELIDLDSWAMLFLLDEISGDYDGGGNSKFFYYNESDGSGKIYAGPMWDKDVTFSGKYWPVKSPSGLAATRWPGQMFTLLAEKEEFSHRVAELYQTVFLPLLKKVMDTGIDDYTQQIARAAYVNAARWELDDPEEASRSVADYLREHTDILEDYWCKQEAFCKVLVYDVYTEIAGSFLIRPGDCLPELPWYEGCGYYLEGTDILFDVSQPIWEDAVILVDEAAAHGS